MSLTRQRSPNYVIRNIKGQTRPAMNQVDNAILVKAPRFWSLNARDTNTDGNDGPCTGSEAGETFF